MRASLKDYKDWMQERADEIAYDEYLKDFYDLTKRQQTEVYDQASSDHTDAYSAWCDAIYERIREERMK